MIPKKRLQVFISSTYLDLKEERQAAVEAVLRSGHIPAGMELFSAGDTSQLKVIKNWIDESDVYMLILGGRYGSVEENSGKSYTHLEYEYAVEKGKPFFAIVITEDCLEKKIRENGSSFMEKTEPQKLKAFKELVCSKIVEFWNDDKDIRIAVHNKISEYNRRDDLIGWVQGNQAVNGTAIAEEMARLTKENADLRQRATSGNNTNDILSFAEQYNFLKKQKLSAADFKEDYYDVFKRLVLVWQPMAYPTFLHFVWYMQWQEDVCYLVISDDTISKLVKYGLYQNLYNDMDGHFVTLTNYGKTFVQRLILTNQYPKAEEFIFPFNPFK
jgi:Domain of unknown function (DUF4062)